MHYFHLGSVGHGCSNNPLPNPDLSHISPLSHRILTPSNLEGVTKWFYELNVWLWCFACWLAVSPYMFVKRMGGPPLSFIKHKVVDCFVGDDQRPPRLTKHKLFKCAPLNGNMIVVEGEYRHYIGVCTFGGYFVQGPKTNLWKCFRSTQRKRNSRLTWLGYLPSAFPSCTYIKCLVNRREGCL